MLNKRSLLLLALLALAALLAACAPATPAATEEAAPEETEAPPEETEAPPEEMAEPEECTADMYGCVVVAPGETIKIGFAGPLTGDNSNYGIDMSQGGLLAIEDAGEFEGHAFELIAEDDQGSPEGGAAVANRFVSRGDIVAVAGHAFSGATNAAIPIYEEVGIPMMSPSATNPNLTRLGSAVFNRVAFSDADQGPVDAEFLYNELGFTKLAVIHDGQTYGQGLAEQVRDTFVELGGEVTAFEAITPGESDYSAVLTAISANPPEAIFFGGYAPEAAVIVNGMAVAGLSDVVFLSDDGTFGTTFIDLAGDNAEGTYSSAAATPPESDLKAEFDARYEETYGVASGVLSGFTWFGYDAVAVLIEAIKSVAIVGDDGTLYIPRGALVEAVRATSGFEGVTGTIVCDEFGECAATGIGVFQVQDGTWVQVYP